MKLFSIIAACLLVFSASIIVTTPSSARKRNSEVTMWQIPSQIGSIGMSYVFRTKNGKVIVIDGGWVQESGFLRGFIAAMGNEVEAWFITHPHDDHAGVLMDILKKPQGMKIKAVYQSSLDPEWYSKYELQCLEFSKEYYATITKSGVNSIEVNPGLTLDIDGVVFKILGIKNPEITSNPYNEQGVVIKVTDSKKSMLFLGDLGVNGGKKLLASEYGKDVMNVDYVQMAHHGQRGVNEDFYKVVNPKYCLWPTPKWVWDNDQGKGFDTGTLETISTRKWIDKLNVKENYLSFEGLVKID